MQNRLPSLRGIEAFVSAADSLSFSTAAERLNVTLSAISHRIHALEEELGLKLFERHGRKIRLTAAGVEYRDLLQPVIGGLRRATHSIVGENNRQLIRIASFQLFFFNWLAPRLDDFLSRYPEAEVELLTLRRREIIYPDLTIRIVRLGEERVDDEQIVQWNLLPICREDVVKRYDIKTPSDLLHARLIENSFTPDAWSRWLDYAGLPTNLSYSTVAVDSTSLTLELARHGVGVGLVSNWMMGPWLGDRMVVPFNLECPYPSSLSINRASGMERPVVTAFRHWLSEQFSSGRSAG